MSSPPESSPVTITSPKPIRGTSEQSHSPIQRRSSIIGNEEEFPTRPRLSPTLARSYNPNDPEYRERQRAMDADMAMHLSRARSNTIVASSPVVSPSPRRLSADEESFPRLSLQEEHDMDVAKQGGQVQGDVETASDSYAGSPPEVVHMNHLSMGHEPSLLVGIDPVGVDDSAMGGLPMYQPTDDRPHFDFSRLQEYAQEERQRLGLHTSPTEGVFDFSKPIPRPSTSAATQYGDGGASQGNSVPTASSDFTIPLPLPRSRQRKLSQSHPGPRRGKMALFEQTNAPPPSLPYRAPHLATGTALSAVPSYEHIPGLAPVGTGAPALPHVTGISTGSGHDRPYRFSFYSNQLSATIHARSLSELPAEGQTFEELFMGSRQHSSEGSRPSTRLGLGGNATARSSGTASPVPGGISKLSGSTRNGGGNGGPPGQGKNGDKDTNTWWLDIQSPTEEEMKLLTKVRYFYLSQFRKCE